MEPLIQKFGDIKAELDEIVGKLSGFVKSEKFQLLDSEMQCLKVELYDVLNRFW